MNRTSPWVYVAAVALQFAALGLCLWAMEDERAPRRALAPPAPAPVPEVPEVPEGPRFGPPPSRAAQLSALAELPPSYITEVADDATQIVRAALGEHFLTFGIYGDGNIRFVDVDGARYTGRAESARARMRETEGTRAFTVQIGITQAGALHASFTGGLHDGETLPLSPLVGRDVA